MNAGLFHLVDGHHGAFQLSLDRAAKIDMFGEVGGAEGCLVKQLETDMAAFGQAGIGHFQAQFRDPLFGHQDCSPVPGQAVFHAELFQLLEYLSGVLRTEPGVNWLESPFFLPLDELLDSDSGGQSDREDEDSLLRGKRLNQLGGLFEERGHVALPVREASS
jgi:hypothetical protein